MAGYYVPKDNSSRRRNGGGGDFDSGSQRRHREPWGYWLKEKFKTVAKIGLLGVALPAYTLLNYNEYKKLPDHQPGWFLGYMFQNAIKDGAGVYNYTMDKGSKLVVPAYNALVAGPLGWEKHELAAEGRTSVYCVDPALSLKGWDSPKDQTMMDFKKKAMTEIRDIHQSSKRPSSHYSQGSYANSNLVLIVEASQYEDFAAGNEIGPIVRVLPSKEAAACPAGQGYKQRNPEL